MVKEDHIIQDGEIIKNLSNGFFSVMLQNRHKLIAYVSGKMKKKRIQIIIGDKVKLEISPYDPNKGIIVYRYNIKYLLYKIKTIKSDINMLFF